MDDVKIGSNRSFGIVFFIVFLVIATYPLINNGELRLWSLIISLIFLFLGSVNSKILNPLNKLWFRFGIFLGKVISPLIMGILLLSSWLNIEAEFFNTIEHIKKNNNNTLNLFKNEIII